MSWPEIVLVLYLVLWTILAIHGAHRLWLLAMYTGARPEAPPPVRSEDWPMVTVQLPIFNELHVAERLIRASVALSAPPGMLEIQVLDDSTDETRHLTRQLVEQLHAQGHDISWHHRTERTGFKAGALEAGLNVCKGQYVAIFDADFIPPKEFLERTIPWLRQGYGMVQARWSHLNLNHSWLTKAQATLLDGHFVVEHAARCYGGRWFNFNGTAGIWDREVIRDAGGWQHDTLTEDLDLSYRAQLRGHRFLYLENLLAPSELPLTIAAFKAQQHRWARGAVQTGKKLLPKIWRAPVSLRHKVEATLHLTGNIGHPALVALALLVPWAIVSRTRSTIEVTSAVDIILFVSATASLFIFYGFAIRKSGSSNVIRRWAEMPFVMAVAIGISISQTRAVIEGIVCGTGVFVRTPKWGVLSQLSGQYRSKVHWVVWLECSVAVYLWSAFIYVAVHQWYLSLPFLMLFALGYSVIGFGSLFERYGFFTGRHKEVSRDKAPSTGIQVAHHSQGGGSQVPVVSESPRRTA